MKPVVSSLVALAIAIAPFGAFAADKHAAKPASTKIAKHKKEKDSADKADKAEKGVVRVKSTKKPMIHHASNVELGGKGHSEPKIDQGVSVVPASLTTKNPHLKTVSAKSSDSRDAKPANAKAGKHGAEKGARKSSEKKHDDDANDGQPERDEDNAELVARIRGGKSDSSDKSEKADKSEKKGDKLDDREGPTPKGKHNGAAKGPCLKDPVEIVRGPEVDRFELTTCEGAIAPLAVEHLSVLVRPGSAPRPTAPAAELAKKKGAELAAGIKRVDPRIALRLQAIVDHFGKKGSSPKLSVISGYRPMSIGSMHASGRAVDFRFEGVKNEDVVAFCKTLVDTGCGYYPNSSFVHLDVRDLGVGHVAWIDASGPGETPRYVSTWPPPPMAVRHARLHQSGELVEKSNAPLDRESVPEAVDEHPGEISP